MCLFSLGKTFCDLFLLLFFLDCHLGMGRGEGGGREKGKEGKKGRERVRKVEEGVYDVHMLLFWEMHFTEIQISFNMVYNSLR